MSKLILTLIILCSFTASVFAADTAKRGTAAVALGAGVIDNSTPDEPTPSPNGPKVPRSKCKVCKGTGYIINGDGNRSECPNCVPDNSPDDSPFDKVGNPRIIPFRPQPQKTEKCCGPDCKCEEGKCQCKDKECLHGDCTCGDNCQCDKSKPCPCKDKDCIVEGSPVTQSVGKCCVDCVCGAGCACSYPGECLVKANGGKKVVICDEAAGTCRIYNPKSGFGPGPVVHPNVGPRPYPPVIEPIKDHGDVFNPTANDNPDKVGAVANELVYAAGKEFKAGQYHKSALYVVQADIFVSQHEDSDSPEIAKAKRRINKARNMLKEKGITNIEPRIALLKDEYNHYVNSMNNYVAQQEAKATMVVGNSVFMDGGSCAGGSCGSSIMMGDGGGCSGGSCGGGSSMMMGGFGRFGGGFGGGGRSCGPGGCR